jgi:hypothetical protein
MNLKKFFGRSPEKPSGYRLARKITLAVIREAIWFPSNKKNHVSGHQRSHLIPVEQEKSR